LVKRDCDPGSTVAIWLANSHEVVEAFVAAEKAGLVRVPIDPGERPGGVDKILAATRPSVLIASTPLLRGLDPSAWLPITLAVGDATAEGTEPYEQVIARGATGATGAPNVEVDDEALYQIYIRMVAGGKDLSVRPTYANWRREVYRNMLLYLGGWYGDPVRDDDIFLNVQQLMHGTAVLGFYPLHLLGCPTVLLERFDAEQTLAAIEQHHITTSFMVPGMVERIQQRAAGGQFDISSLKRVLYGGAPMSRDALTAAIDTLGDVLVQVYGRYDGAWPITILDQQAHRRMRDGAGELWGSCGRWAPFVEARLAGPNLEPIAQGEKGEVVVRGDGVVPAARAEEVGAIRPT
jgi:acyl-CoA synthetase (AMP-forming)/AMP-acid ligase II